MKKKMGIWIFVLSSVVMFAISLILPTNLEATIYGQITGKVIGEDTGKGIKGVKVDIWYNHPKFGILHLADTATNDAGLFSFRMLKDEGTYYLTFSPDPPYYGDEFIYVNKKDIDVINIKKGTIISNYTKVLKIGGSISGMVFQSNGVTPAPNISMKITPPVERPIIQTDRNGKYIIQGLPPRDNYSMEIIKHGYWRKKIINISVKAGRETPNINFVVDMNDTTGIEGQIILPEGKAPDFVLIYVFNEYNNEEGEAAIDENGRYSLVGLESGKYLLISSYKGKIIEKEIYIIKGKKVNVDLIFNDPTILSINTYLPRDDFTQSTNAGPFFLSDSKNVDLIYEDLNNSQVSIKDIQKDFPVWVDAIISNPPNDYYNNPKIRIKAMEDLKSSYYRALNLVINNCLHLPICIQNKYPVDKIKGKTVRINTWYVEDRQYCHGEGDGSNNTIRIVNYHLGRRWLDNLMLHEINHILGIHDEKTAEACANLCFDEDTQNTYYGSTWKDCNCEKAEEKSSSSAAYISDNPDDNYSSSSPQLTADMVYESSNPSLLVMKSGYWEKAGALLNNLKIPFSYIEPDQSPMEMSNPVPVLLIPSGGLMGLEKSSQLQNILSDYVLQGGAILVFAQQHGYEYSVLPRQDGKMVGAYGWREDQSCWARSIYLDTWHSALTSVTTPDLSVMIDGHIYDYPEDATVFLRRTRNGEPALVTWKVGEGQVIASSLFTDFQGSITDQRIVRDLITWAKNPNIPIPEYNLRTNANPEVSLNLDLKNITDTPASKAKVLWLDPDRNVLFEEEKLVSLPPGGNLTYSTSHVFSTSLYQKLGIGHVDYILYDSEGVEIQSQAETDSGRYSFSRPPAGTFDLPDLTASITSAGEVYLSGFQATFQVNITNRSEQDKKLHIWWNFYGNMQQYWKEITAPAMGSIKEEITVDLDNTGMHNSNNGALFCLHFYEDNGKGIYISLRPITKNPTNESWPYVGSLLRVIQVNGIDLSIQSDKKSYVRSQQAKFIIPMKNGTFSDCPMDYTFTVQYYLYGQIVKTFSDQGAINLSANGEITLEKTYQFGDDSRLATYEAVIALSNGRRAIGGARCHFHLDDSGVRIAPQLPSTFIYGHESPVQFDLRGGNFPAEQGNLSLKLISALEEILFQESKSLALAVGETKNVAFSVPMTGLKFGANRLEYAYSDETGRQFSGGKLLEYKLYWPSVSFDKSYYQIGETARLHFTWSGAGQVETDLGIEVALPETGYAQTTQAHYLPGSAGGAAEVDIPLTANLLSARPEVFITFISPSGERNASNLNLAVSQPYITLTPQYDKSFYRVRESLSFNLEVEGKGGFIVPLPSQLRVEIPSLNYNAVQAVTVTPAGKIEVPVSLPIPETLAAGSYDVTTTLTLPSGGGVIGQSRYVIGPATWKASPDKISYLAGESMNIKIGNLGGVDGGAAYRLTLEGSRGEKLVMKEGQAAVLAGGEMSETLPISDQAKNGTYVLHTSITDQATGQEIVETHKIEISGLSSSLEVKTGKDKYFVSEEINGRGRIQAGPLDVKNGVLDLKVTSVKPVQGVKLYEGTGYNADNNIWNLVFDRNGNPVAGAESGILRRSNGQWQCLLESGSIARDLYAARSGKLWVASYTGAMVYDGTSWKTYAKADGLADDSVYSIAEDGEGNIWLGTDNGLSKFDGAAFTNYKRSNGCPFYSIYTVAVDATGAVWIGSSSGAARFAGGEWTVYTAGNSGLIHNYVYAISVDLDGHVWFGSFSGVAEYDGANWSTYTAAETGLEMGSVTRLAFDVDNHLWLISGNNKLVEYDGASWRQFEVSDVLGLSGVRDVAADPNGVMWTCTDRGLSRHEGGRWNPVFIDRRTGGLLGMPEGMVVDSANNKWIATFLGLLKFDGENWKHYLTAGDEPIGGVASLALGRNDVLWLATDKGLKRFDGVNLTVYPYPEKLGQQWNLIASMVEGADGKVWVDNGSPKQGLWAFDGTNWREFSVADGLPDNRVLRLAVDKQGKIWAGTWWAGVGVYDGSSWVNYNTSNGLSDNNILSIFVDSKGMVWIGTSNGLNRFDGQAWKVFTTADGLPSNRVVSIAEEASGVIRALAQEWAPTPDILLSKKDVSIAEEASGAIRTLAQDWTPTADGLPSNNDVSIAEDASGAVRTLAQEVTERYYLAGFDGTGWSFIPLEASGSAGPPEWGFLAIDRNNDIWLVSHSPAYLGKYGEALIDDAVVWSENRAVNQSANSASDSEIRIGRLGAAGKYTLKGTLFASTGQELASSSYPFQAFSEGVSLSLGPEKRYVRPDENVVITGEVMNGSGQEETALTLRIYKKLNDGAEAPAYEDSFSLPSRESRAWSFTLNAVNEGKFSLRGVVLRQNVAVSSAESGFESVRPVIEVEIDAPEIAGNETFDLKVKLANRGKIDGNIHVEIAPLSYAQDVSLTPGEEQTLFAPAQLGATTEYVIAFSGDLESQVRKTVVYGYAVAIEFPASLIYPKGAVTIPLTVRNTGSLDSTFEVVYTLSLVTNPNLPLAELKRTYSLSVNSGLADALLFSLAPGEYTLKYASPLAQGQVLLGVVDPGAGLLTLQPQSVYAQGLATMPLTLLNQAPYGGDIDLTFKVLRGQNEVFSTSRSYYLNAGETGGDSISFPVDSEGEYTFLVQGAKIPPLPPVGFRVVPLERMETAVTFQAASGGILPVAVNLRNTGFQDFQGTLAIRSDFYSSEADARVARGQTQSIDLAVNLASGAAGEHSVAVVLTSAAGKETVLETKTINIETADVVVAELPSGKSFAGGEEATLTFKLRNQGNLEGEAAFGLKIMDILDETRKIVIPPGAEEAVAFTFDIPEDLVGQDYPAFYKLEGTGVKGVKEGEVRFSIQGIAIDVSAQLDKTSYSEGETARLTLTAANRNQAPVELFAKVGYLDYEEEQSFTLQTSATLAFSIPLPRITEGKVFYGIYHRDGRGVHLNDIYIYKKGDGVNVETDRQVYQPGSSVQVLITTPHPGQMRISAPGYDEEFAVSGSAGRSFTLPSDLRAGTYALSWEFVPADGSEAESSVKYFDVAGLKIVVAEATLSKGKYAPGETIEAALVLESNQNMAATLKLWVVNPAGGDREVVSKSVNLSAAEHAIVRESFAFATEYAGMHSVVYGLYGAGNQLLVSGSEAFDCGGAVLLAVSTEKTDYPLAAEEVKTRVQLYGDGEATLILFINGEPVKTVSAALSGVTAQEVTIEPSLLRPGRMTLRAEVQRDGLISRKETSFSYGTALPDLTIATLTSSQNGITYKLRAEVVNQGLTSSGPTAVSFYEGDPAQGGVLIEERLLAGLNPGESAYIEISWSGQAKNGLRTVFAVADRANAVREFNEDNNTASLSLDVPDLFHQLMLDKAAFSAFEDMNMVTRVENNRGTPVQGQWSLKIVNLASQANIWESAGEIAPIAPYGQLLSSHAFNWGANPEGEYRITQTLTLDQTAFEDQAVVTVLKTEKISAAFVLDPAKINPNRDELVNVALDLQNRGNVSIEKGLLTLEVLKKETGQKADEKQWEFNLAVGENRKETKAVTLNLAEGFYALRLLFKGAALDEKELEAKIQISYSKQESLAPNVLVLGNPLSLLGGLFWSEERKKIYEERVLIEEALRSAGISYKFETNPLLQIRELRSGRYNIIILVDIAPIFPHVAQEIEERVWNGDGVIGIFRAALWPDFIKELFGMEAEGMVRRNQVCAIRTYATPISQEGAFSLKSDFMNFKAVDPNLILVGTKEIDQKPAIGLRTYGEGRAVAFGFGLTAAAGEPAYAALRTLLVNSVLHLKPRHGNRGTIARLIPVELSFQNPTSSVVGLKIVEELPSNAKLVSVAPEPANQQPLTWTFTLEPSGFKYLRYTLELPDVAGSYEMKTSIVKVEASGELPIDTIVLSSRVEKTIRETLQEEIAALAQLPVSTLADREAARIAAANLTAALNRDETKLFAYHLNLWNVLTALTEVEKILTADTGIIRTRLIELMLAYERKTVEAEQAMKIPFIIDLKRLF